MTVLDDVLRSGAIANGSLVVLAIGSHYSYSFTHFIPRQSDDNDRIDQAHGNLVVFEDCTCEWI